MSPREDQDKQSPTLFMDDADLTSVTSLSSSASSCKRRVSFGVVQVREHARCVGDHPNCSTGCPMSLSWESRDLPSTPLLEYEKGLSMRKRSDFRLTGLRRRKLLMDEFDAKADEIVAAEREVMRVQRQREETKKGGKVAMHMERTMKRAKRAFDKKQQLNGIRENILMGFAAASGAMMPLGVLNA